MSKTYKVASFGIDHRTLRAGIYLRSELNQTKSWDVRLVAPSEHRPMTSGAVHVLEHCFAEWLRDELGHYIIAVCPMGCLTGMYVITSNRLEIEDIADALREVLKNHFPLSGIKDVPGMNEIQCGNPGLNDINGANEYAQRLSKILENV